MTDFAFTRRSFLIGSTGLVAAATLPRPASAAMPSPEEVANAASTPALGNAEGDVTIVEIVDYQCGYCKLSYSEIVKLMAEDPGIRLVLKDWPVFGPASGFAARALLAYRDEPAIYGAVVNALLTDDGRLSERRVEGFFADAGVDAPMLEDRMAYGKAGIDAILQLNATHAAQFQLKGTPAILVGGRLFKRAMPIEDLRQAVAVARNKPVDSAT